MSNKKRKENGINKSKHSSNSSNDKPHSIIIITREITA